MELDGDVFTLETEKVIFLLYSKKLLFSMRFIVLICEIDEIMSLTVRIQKWVPISGGVFTLEIEGLTGGG